MLTLLRNLVLLISLLFITSISWGLKSDSQLPAKFNSDQILFNQKTGVTIFVDNVQMDQGSTHLTADKVTIYKDKNNKIYKVVAEGKQAHYTTLPDGETKPLDAYADTIEYYTQEKKAVLDGNAYVVQEPNQLRATHIVYDMANKNITSTATAGSQSVLVLQPQTLKHKP